MYLSSAATTDEVDESARRFAQEHGLAGLAVGIVRGGELVHVTALGESSIEPQRPVTARSVFRVGSISKLFTGIAVLQLVAEGRLDLDGPVNDHLRGFSIDPPAGAPAVTPRHLLTHTSGIGELRRYSDIVRPFIGMAVAPELPIPSFAEYYAPKLRAEVPAGRKWAYSNHGVATLGAVIETVTGERFADYMRRRILDPLGMSSSDFSRSERVSAELCDGHARTHGRNKRVRYLDIIPGPAGSLFSSVEDMARFVTAVCNGGDNILDRSSLDEMMSPQFRIHPRLPAMGLSFFISDLDGHRVVSHDGGVSGFVSHVRVAPDDGVGIVVLTNSANMKIGMAIDRFGAELLQMTLPTSPTRRVGRADTLSVGSADPKLELTGAYGLRPGLNTNARSWMYLGGEVEVLSHHGHLAFRSFTGPARKPVRLQPVEGGDELLFEVDVASMTLDVAFSDGAIHLGPPLNVTLVRRKHGFRWRSRVVPVVATVLIAAALASAAVRHRD